MLSDPSCEQKKYSHQEKYVVHNSAVSMFEGSPKKSKDAAYTYFFEGDMSMSTSFFIFPLLHVTMEGYKEKKNG